MADEIEEIGSEDSTETSENTEQTNEIEEIESEEDSTETSESSEWTEMGDDEIVEDEIVPVEEDETRKPKEKLQHSVIGVVVNPDQETYHLATPVDLNPTRILIPVTPQPWYRRNQLISKNSYHTVNWVLTNIIRTPTNAHRFELIFLSILPQLVLDPIVENKVFRKPIDFTSADLETRGVPLLYYVVSWMDHCEVPCRGWVRKGFRREIICEEANRLVPDLLIVEGRHPDRTYRQIHKNISKFCVKHAKCPVSVFPFVTEDSEGDEEAGEEVVEDVQNVAASALDSAAEDIHPASAAEDFHSAAEDIHSASTAEDFHSASAAEDIHSASAAEDIRSAAENIDSDV